MFYNKKSKDIQRTELSMKEKYYYIGEVSSLLDISTQTLRYYDKIGLVRPAKVNERTGYRQYTYDQIHYIERIKYLQKLGLPLTEIRIALDGGGTEHLTKLLTQHKEALQRKIEALQDTVDTIDWYVSYYNYLKENAFPDIPFKKTMETRYVLAAPIYPGEPIYGAAGYRLTEAQSKEPFKQLAMLRQNGYILDFHRLLQNEISALYYFMYIKEKPDFSHPYIQEIPGGDYFCFRVKLLSETCSNTWFKTYFEGSSSSHLVVADEYEDNFYEFQHCTYEVQVRISP